MAGLLLFVPYSPLKKHGGIGDRRTAGLIGADGTLSWFCLPNYDAAPSSARCSMCSGAGFWRFGPLASLLGQQDYLADSAALVTAWSGAGWKLELTDTMLWPQRNRSPGRNNGAWWCATCAAAGVCTMQVCPRDGFDTSPVTANRYPCALAT